MMPVFTTESLHPAIVALVAQLSARPEVRRVWLFGSRARGDHEERSDVDLAIEAPQASDSDWLAIQALADDAETLLAIDLVRWDKGSEALRRCILEEGEILYERTKGPSKP